MATNEQPDRDGAGASPFATNEPQVRTPSTGMIQTILRGLPDADTVLDEQSVEKLCQRIRASARFLSEFALTSDAVDRAESFHYLLLMMAYAVDASLLNSDPLEPMFSAPYRPHLLDWGAASPDSVYRRAMVRDDHSYRVHGRLGNAKYLSIDFRQSYPPYTILAEEIETDGEGNFEIFLGGERRAKNWWSLTQGTNGVLVREFFDDWLAARKSLLRIDCLDGDTAPRPEHRSSHVAAEFDLIGDWILDGAIRYWAERSADLAASARNGFRSELHRGDTKLPVVNYGWWDLAPDDALLIEFDDPEAEFWGLQLATSLWHTLDYANRLTTINCAQAHRDPDDVYRLVLSARDPGVHNWLDTTGLSRGVMIMRFVRAAKAAPLRTTLCPLADVARVLRATTPCTPDERRAQIAERREGVARMVYD